MGNYDPVICSCMGVHESDILKAIEERGARSFSDVQRITKAGMGGCGGRVCRQKIEALIKKSSRK